MEYFTGRRLDKVSSFSFAFSKHSLTTPSPLFFPPFSRYASLPLPLTTAHQTCYSHHHIATPDSYYTILLNRFTRSSATHSFSYCYCIGGSPTLLATHAISPYATFLTQRDNCYTYCIASRHSTQLLRLLHTQPPYYSTATPMQFVLLILQTRSRYPIK